MERKYKHQAMRLLVPNGFIAGREAAFEEVFALNGAIVNRCRDHVEIEYRGYRLGTPAALEADCPVILASCEDGSYFEWPDGETVVRLEKAGGEVERSRKPFSLEEGLR